MIIVCLQERLVNVLFQYALGRHLALRNNAPLQLDFSTYLAGFGYRKFSPQDLLDLLGYFNLSADMLLPPMKRWFRHIGGLVPPLRKALRWAYEREFNHLTMFREPPLHSTHFFPDVLNLPNNAFLTGFFQNQAYFNAIETTIRADLTINMDRLPLRSLSALVDKIRTTNSVAINVRRGDYLNKYNRALNHVCDLNYYLNAVNVIKERVEQSHFFVVSDDITWCQAHLQTITPVDFVDTRRFRKQAPLLDFYIVSSCRHQLIANSSFSWWGAWLNSNPDKQVIVPNRWFNDPVMSADAMEGLIPSEWIRVAV
jgi:hypothetical protein